MERIRLALLTAMAFVCGTLFAFADIADPEEATKSNMLIPIILVGVGVVAIVLIIRARRRKK